MATEWTEEDKVAYMRFAQEVRDIRDGLERSLFHRVEKPTATTHRHLTIALDRLGAR